MSRGLGREDIDFGFDEVFSRLSGNQFPHVEIPIRVEIFGCLLEDLEIGGHLLHRQIKLLLTDLGFGILALFSQEEEGLLQELLQVVSLFLLEIIV